MKFKSIICVISFLLLAATSALAEEHVVQKVIDGESLVLANGDEIHLIGVDTPAFSGKESNRRNAERLGVDPTVYESYASKVKRLVKALLEGRTIRLELDENNQALQHRDAHGRLLAYAYIDVICPGRAFAGHSTFELVHGVKGDHFTSHPAELFVNKVLIQQGYGSVQTEPPFKFMDDFKRSEEKAKVKRKGFWKSKRDS